MAERKRIDSEDGLFTEKTMSKIRVLDKTQMRVV